jgi:hypothetical protein
MSRGTSTEPFLHSREDSRFRLPGTTGGRYEVSL